MIDIIENTALVEPDESGDLTPNCPFDSSLQEVKYNSRIAANRYFHGTESTALADH